MKIFRISLFVLMITILASSQGAIAATNDNNTGLSVSGFDDKSAAYAVSITSVATGSYDDNVTSKSEFGTYDFDKAEVELTVTLDFSGFASFADANNYTGENNATYTYTFQQVVGQLNLIIDGAVSTGGAFANPDGSILYVTGYGDHVVTFLYTGFDKDGEFVYASDSMVVRLRSEGTTFGAFGYGELNLKMKAKNTADGGETINRLSNIGSGRNVSLQTELEKSVSGIETSITVNGDGVADELLFKGEYDATGTVDDAQASEVVSTEGHVFILDAKGAHLYDDGGFFRGDTPEIVYTTRSADDKSAKSYLGMLVLADGGLLVGSDAEGIGDPDGSYDFFYATAGIFVGGDVAPPTAVPGFEVAVTFTALAIIAFVIPRKYRK